MKTNGQNANFKTNAMIATSVAFSLVYAIFLLVQGILYHSGWFYVMSAYYLLLFAMRCYVFAKVVQNNSPRAKTATMGVCGYCLLGLNVVVSVSMFVLIYTNRAVDYHVITVISLATYTFYSIAMAIVGSVKQFRQNNPVYLSAKAISMVSTSVSLVNLTNTMLATFGDDSPALKSVILPILSAFVTLFITTCAILLICKSKQDLRKLDNEEKR